MITGMNSGEGWIRLAASLLLLACAAVTLTLTLTPTPVPTQPPTLTEPLPPTATAVPEDTGWLPVTSGMERRYVTMSADLGDERVTLVRFDPDLFTVRVRAATGDAQTVRAWSEATDALLTVNAGYFDENNRPLGLLIADGQRFGNTYPDFAGMLVVTPDGETGMRWLREHPYDPQEPFLQAVQSFPVLVKPGGVMGFPADADEGNVSRRIVVAQDGVGRLILLIAPRGYLSLHALAQWLVEPDLDIDIALNLDGGNSAGLWLRETPAAQIDSLVGVPAVITVD